MATIFYTWNIGEQKEMKVGDREYILTISKDKREEEKYLHPLQTSYDTMLKKFIAEVIKHEELVTLSFVSYFQLSLLSEEDLRKINIADINLINIPLFTKLPEEEEIKKKRERLKKDVKHLSKDLESFLKISMDMIIFGPFLRLINNLIDGATENGYIRKAQRKGKKERIKLLEKIVDKRIGRSLEEEKTQLQKSVNDIIKNAGKVSKALIKGAQLEELARINFQKVRNIKFVFEKGLLDKNNINIFDKLIPFYKNELIENFMIFGICPSPDCNYLINEIENFRFRNYICPNCNKELLTFLRGNLNRDVLKCWISGLLPEIVLAEKLSQENWIDTIYVHKKIHQKKEKGPTKGVEADVIAKTTNEKLLIFEVTARRDHNIDRLHHKTDNLMNAEIEFDCFIQISPTMENRIYKRKNVPCYSFPLHYIHSLDKVKEELQKSSII